MKSKNGTRHCQLDSKPFNRNSFPIFVYKISYYFIHLLIGRWWSLLRQEVRGQNAGQGLYHRGREQTPLVRSWDWIPPEAGLSCFQKCVLNRSSRGCIIILFQILASISAISSQMARLGFLLPSNFPTTLCHGVKREKGENASLVIQTHVSRVAPDWDLWRTLYRWAPVQRLNDLYLVANAQHKRRAW